MARRLLSMVEDCRYCLRRTEVHVVSIARCEYVYIGRVEHIRLRTREAVACSLTISQRVYGNDDDDLM